MKRLTIAAATLLIAVSLAAQSEQATPPPPAPPRPVTVPQPAETTLPNGLRVIAIEKKGLPLAAARLMLATGGEADPAPLAGLADMTGSLLTKGTKTRSAEQIAREVEALGATIDSGAGWDNSYVAISTLSSNFGTAMKYVADVVVNPVFAKDEIERLREQNIDALNVALHEPQSLASFVASRVLFPGEPYGHNLGGTLTSLRRIQQSDIRAYHAKYYRPDNAVLVIAGNVTAEDAFRVAKDAFGRWPRPAAAGPMAGKESTESKAKSGRVVVVDMPDAGQAAVMVVQRGIRRADPRFVTSQVANMVLGGDYSSRLNEEVRIKRGLSYGAGSSFDPRRDAGPFTASAQTKNESAVEVAKIIAAELARMAAEPVAPAELTPRKANLTGRFGRAIATMSGLVGRVAGLALYGLPLSDINRYLPEVEAVSAADVQKFAASVFATPPDIVIVGDAKKFADALKKEYPQAEVVPLAQLDLDSATLRK